MNKQILIIFVGLIILNCNYLIGQNDLIIETPTKEDSIIKEELKKKEQIKIDLLNKAREIQEKTLMAQNEAQKKQRIVIYTVSLFFILLIATIVGLIIRNRKLKRLLKD